ncbi:hypothetical protein SBOR_3652 [Sclerotinia borealis F-4128]|uniref:Methyltransferase domain-containing protein n=1 Tax=Sclerotinia borealis (strain F-4128) TaxID=1432307 RepID=W9CN83_SCLBF|nr:hypothetical protein SBOR_3652 [Sclerotinia borealis F-4128]
MATISGTSSSQPQSIAIHTIYDSRAPTYDDATTFHKSLAHEYVEYAKPVEGEKLLDLACGTGLVGFEWMNGISCDEHVSSQSEVLNYSTDAINSHAPLSQIHGIDISSGMLSIARSKIPSLPKHNHSRGIPLPPLDPRETNILFEHHDITSLSTLPSLSDAKGRFDIITICSALMLLSSPLENMRSWIPYLKPTSPTPPGGRLILDIPHPSSMLGLSIFYKLSLEFGISILGSREWIGNSGIVAVENLGRLMKEAGLVDVKAFETRIFHDIPAATPVANKIGEIIDKGEENEYREWPATNEAGKKIFDIMTQWKSLENWREGTEDEKKRKRERWGEEWVKLGVMDENEGREMGELVVREEGRLIIGVGFRG